MDKVFWVVADELAGREGPDRAPWRLDALRDGGIGAILSVNDGLLCHAEDIADAGLAYACVPLSDNAPPRPGDDAICLDALPKAYAFAEDCIDKGRRLLVHCSAGKDRTGLFMCYYLQQRFGVPVKEAIEQVYRVRPIALSAEGWDRFAEDVLGRCSTVRI